MLFYVKIMFFSVLLVAEAGKNRNISKSDRTAPLAWFQVEPWYLQPPLPILTQQSAFSSPDPTPVPSPEFSRTSHRGPIAENIHCNSGDGNNVFTAILKAPEGFNSVPVFRDAPHQNSECVMRKSMQDGKIFLMKIDNFNRCGVNVYSNDGKNWMTVTIRFPYVQGLILAQDEYVMLICQQQDRKTSKKHFLDFKGNLPKVKNPVFRNLPNEFQYDIGLFTKSLLNDRFETRIIPGRPIPVGQEVQLRTIVNSGKGWKYAALTDVVIQRLKRSSHDYDPSPNSEIRSSARLSSILTEYEFNNIKKQHDSLPDDVYLVFENGCRNPIYTSIAAHHPFVDPTSPLIVNFNFKAFMFEGTKEDYLRISATIIACMEYTDCQKNLCSENEDRNYREKRDVSNSSQTLTDANNKNKITSELNMKVIMPDYIKVLEQNFSDDAEVKNSYFFLFTITWSLCLLFSLTIILIMIINRKKCKFNF
ncbi:uncharacterized protein [Centruroides vittatus]|uniref:uncharacterized protein n=1 Tax=Centruroides vittatus TaxID=120091 RepID=UPI0035102406